MECSVCGHSAGLDAAAYTPERLQIPVHASFMTSTGSGISCRVRPSMTDPARPEACQAIGRELHGILGGALRSGHRP